MFFYTLTSSSVDLTILDRLQQGTPSVVLDDQGQAWAHFCSEHGELVDFTDIPRHVIQAFVAAEDHTFFQHHGISFKGIIRSLLINAYYGKRMQGASTITQQLVRMLFFDAKKTFKRKIKEQIMALIVEARCTKEQILTAYLNHVYCGQGMYGIAAASKRLWNTTVDRLTLDQAATLAALVKAPTHYCPLINPLSAQQRRNVVLYAMYQQQFITHEQYQQARLVPLHVVEQDDEGGLAYVREMVRQWAEHTFGKRVLYEGGLRIQTTISKELQRTMHHAFMNRITHLRTQLGDDVDGSMVTMEVKTGALKALIGGFNFRASAFNRLNAQRQFGSLCKPFVYACALQDGSTFATSEVDEPMTLTIDGNSWQPGNANNSFAGPMTRAYALVHSNNIVAIKTLLKRGAIHVANLLNACGIYNTHTFPSLALGCIDTTVRHAAAAFNIFATHGIYIEPYYIAWVKNAHGIRIWSHQPVTRRVLPATISDQVLRVLCVGMDHVARYVRPWIESQACGKTGTTNECRTCWFAGSTPDYTSVVMIGRDNNKPLGTRVFPIHTAFPIWVDVHKQLPATLKTFTYDPSLECHYIDALTGTPVAATDAQALPILVPIARSV